MLLFFSCHPLSYQIYGLSANHHKAAVNAEHLAGYELCHMADQEDYAISGVFRLAFTVDAHLGSVAQEDFCIPFFTGYFFFFSQPIPMPNAEFCSARRQQRINPDIVRSPFFGNWTGKSQYCTLRSRVCGYFGPVAYAGTGWKIDNRAAAVFQRLLPE